MTITFSDNSALNTLGVNSYRRFFQNSDRECLEFSFDPAEVSFETLRSFFSSPEKCASIAIDGEYLYNDYTLRVKQSLENVTVSEATPDAPAVSAERFTVIMAQKTYLEKALEAILARA